MIGDAHVPDRARELPPAIVSELRQATRTRQFDVTLCTGDFGSDATFAEYLRAWTRPPPADRLFMVQGNMDAFAGITLPPYVEVPVAANLVVGLFHGHKIHPRGDRAKIVRFARAQGVQVIIGGHSHADDVYLDAGTGILYLNPGSCTGAWSFVASGVPSYMVLETDAADPLDGPNEASRLAVTLVQAREGAIETAEWAFRVRGKKILRR